MGKDKDKDHNNDLQGWMDVIHKQGEERLARRAKYPEHAKFEDNADRIETVQSFLNWAEERCGISGGRPQLAKENQPSLVCEFVGIDYEKLKLEAEQMDKEDEG